MVAVGRFGIVADGRPIRLGGRAFDLLSMRTGSRAQDCRAAYRIDRRLRADPDGS